MGTWRLVEPPKGVKPIPNKWVFAKKKDNQGNITKYKARLVAKGCSQRPGRDYEETHSPVVRLETLRALLAIAPGNKLFIQQMDVKGAYLNGTLKETVYMRQPEGFEDGTGRVCLLIKPLYGLKQAGRAWNFELDMKLKKHGFTRLRTDSCVYIKRNGEEISIIAVWVDDLLIFATTQTIMDTTKNAIKSEWETTDMGEPSKIVGLEFCFAKESITISQKLYIEELLKDHGMAQANPVGMPLDPHYVIGPNPEGSAGTRSNPYAVLLGELQYLANATRPDIAFAVNRMASYTANPSPQHMGTLKRILRYLAGTRDLGITYSGTSHSDDNNLFYGYADAAYGNADDCKSTSGYVFIAGNGAITWKSKKQTTIALSSTEAEYIALSEAAREAMWLKQLYNELGFTQRSPILIKGDNDGSIAMTKNPQFHKRSKHIEIRWHWIRDLVQNNDIIVESCRDPEQTADVLTKALSKPKQLRHTSGMGLAPA